MKRIAVLGSTGSIGANTLDVIASHPDRLTLVGLAAHSRIDVLYEQIARYAPRIVAVFDKENAHALRRRVAGSTTIVAGVEGCTEVATHPEVDLVVVGTSGRDALVPLWRAIEAGKQIALASKELLVMAGELLMPLARQHGATVIPVDSEHAGLFQLLQGVRHDHVARLIITGSGGPLWTRAPESLDRVSRAEVLRHPKWRMGPKITVDSATLMNKGLEVIEARWLFDMPLERVRVVIHPQAAIHAMVELVDGSCLAQASSCDMRLPIQYALSFPDRWPSRAPRLEFPALERLQFFDPDPTRFPCLALAAQAARQGGTACAVLSAANDEAVGAFLREEIVFTDIPRLIRETLSQHTVKLHPTLDEVLQADQWARERVQGALSSSTMERIMAR